MNDSNIEQDALHNTDWQQPPDTPHDHPHNEIKSFIATPRTDTGFFQRVRSLFVDEMKPGIHIAQKDSNGLRHMFIITSNSYKDRENETLTSEALKAYEASCYPGEDLFHCDNPLLWWHDDDVPMGEIVAVNYSEPFLIEVARELPTAVSKVLWDYAEQNGDNAGASHRFGYLEDDRLPNGDFKRIFKQETTYLPERALAANLGTYAGVIKEMSSDESDKRLNQIFEQVAGIKDAASKIHAKSGELERELAASGIQHKAAKAENEFPPENPQNEVPETEVETEIADEEQQVEGETKAEPSANLGQLIELVSQMYALIMQSVDGQQMLMDSDMGFSKSLKALETRLEEKATAEKAYNDNQKTYIETLEKRVAILEAQAKLAPRSVTQEKGSNPEALKAVVEQAIEQKQNGELVNVPGWGPLKPPIDYTKVTGK